MLTSIIRNALLATVCILCLHGQAAGPVTFYVSPGGSDAWSGTVSSPNADRTNGPFGSLARARDAIRELRADGKQLQGGVRVLLRGGTHRLEEPFRLSPEDSGTSEGPVVFAAFEGEEPVVSGGREIRGFTKTVDGAYTVTLDAAKDRSWPFRQLFISGRRYILARSPNAGQYFIRKAVLEGDVVKTGQWAGKSKTAFGFFPGDLEAWDNLAEVNLKLYFSWNSGLYPLQSVDEERHVARLAGPTVWPMPRSSGQCYLVENHPGALDSPGEWQLDRVTGVLRVMPSEDEDVSELDVVAPVVEHLVLGQGDPDNDRFLEHIRFEGISFQHGAWYLPPEGHGDPQAESTLNAALQFDGARNVTIEGCEIAHIGNYGIWLRDACIGNRVVRNHLHDLGGGGIRVGVHTRPVPDVLSHDNLISNNFIHDGGHIHAGAVGICVGYAHDNMISHNEVCDFRYTGISLGWNWSITRSGTRQNAVERNHVHHVMRVLDDGGGIYSLGLTPGSVVRNNHIHHVGRLEDAVGHGIYLDGGSSGVLAENNLIHDVGGGGVRIQHGTACLTVLNNIAAYCGFGLGIDSERTNIFAYNIVYMAGEGTPFRPATEWQSYNKIIKHNVYWHEDSAPITFLKYTFEEWQKIEGIKDIWYTPKMDERSRIVDPQFVDAKARDFRLAPDSPALAVGFKPFDMAAIGLKGAAEGRNLPASCPMQPLLPTETKLRAMFAKFYEDGFELEGPGGKPAMVEIIEAEKGYIVVSDEKAATGKHSLKFVDAAGLDVYHLPHMYYRPNLHDSVRMRLDFDLYREPGAMLWVEWRDYVGPRQVGPSIRIQADDALLLDRTPTECKIPDSTWVHVQMTAGLGEIADGHWDMTITAGDDVLFDQKGLAGEPDFTSVQWLGFVSYGTEPAVFYLDNLRFQPVDRVEQ
ncbi:MAG: right-handed parallel beta-helix repeat-containing protein [Lentisphaerae bacterium]|nr:right-handed parallel beta-helix repeat-containing protein [Lentisphaerota bacterium]